MFPHRGVEEMAPDVGAEDPGWRRSALPLLGGVTLTEALSSPSEAVRPSVKQWAGNSCLLRGEPWQTKELLADRLTSCLLRAVSQEKGVDKAWASRVDLRRQ